MVAELNFDLLENFRSWTVILHGQGLLHRLFHRKFRVTDQSAKTAKLFHLKQFAIYSIGQ